MIPEPNAPALVRSLDGLLLLHGVAGCQIFCGNDDARDGQNATAVWADDYVGVWHFTGDGDDATAHGNDGSFQGDAHTGDAGMLAGGLVLGGDDDYVNVSEHASLTDLAPLRGCYRRGPDRHRAPLGRVDRGAVRVGHRRVAGHSRTCSDSRLLTLH